MLLLFAALYYININCKIVFNINTNIDLVSHNIIINNIITCKFIFVIVLYLFCKSIVHVIVKFELYCIVLFQLIVFLIIFKK